ncbi:MAG TPA: hypothetical protein VK582_09255 [Pyrinomonadaceae bacterium]|nr:hypothetical protein [Pyrinomonadaceae bacterium]
MKAQPGDRVKIKNIDHRGTRGIVTRLNRDRLVVKLDDRDELVELKSHEVTNFSLAARKAWQSMPHKRVGRPKGSRVCDRTSVTLRIDRDLWDEFRALESNERIKDRTTVINAMLREKLAELKSEQA